MNLVDCTVTDGAADLGGVRVPLPADLAARAAGRSPLKFGVRPENLRLASAAGDIAVPAEVSLLEPLGAETLVTMKLGGTEMVARCPASFRPPPGTTVTLHVNPMHLHLFDAASGAALH